MFKSVQDLKLGDVVTNIHGQMASDAFRRDDGTPFPFHGKVTVTRLEFDNPDDPESKRVKLTAVRTEDSGESALAELHPQEPVEIEGDAGYHHCCCGRG